MKKSMQKSAILSEDMSIFKYLIIIIYYYVIIINNFRKLDLY